MKTSTPDLILQKEIKDRNNGFKPVEISDAEHEANKRSHHRKPVTFEPSPKQKFINNQLLIFEHKNKRKPKSKEELEKKVFDEIGQRPLEIDDNFLMFDKELICWLGCLSSIARSVLDFYMGRITRKETNGDSQYAEVLRIGRKTNSLCAAYSQQYIADRIWTMRKGKKVHPNRSSVSRGQQELIEKGIARDTGKIIKFGGLFSNEKTSILSFGMWYRYPIKDGQNRKGEPITEGWLQEWYWEELAINDKDFMKIILEDRERSKNKKNDSNED